MNSNHELIAGLLTEAENMPVDLQNDPAGLLSCCLEMIETYPNDPTVLQTTITTVMLFIAAKHKRRITAQLRQHARKKREGMH